PDCRSRRPRSPSSSWSPSWTTVAGNVRRDCAESVTIPRTETPGSRSRLPGASVGVPRFELGTSPTRTERATRLRYTPDWRQTSGRSVHLAQPGSRHDEGDQRGRDQRAGGDDRARRGEPRDTGRKGEPEW